ncbi:MAG: toll/interleukin-1 receptor domain-containing protein [Actinobacteria bacterium]|nr:toll/interleukin-1 receptor domain-containing protein [Actinomycetota bacterium]
MMAAHGQTDRCVFISHRHADKEIADALREFIRGCTWGRVKAHQSSFAENAPRVGYTLTDELAKQLKDSRVVLCVYTVPEEDWSYCMWECGLAIDPEARDTRIVIFQFSGHYPTPFQDHVRVDVRNIEDVQNFVTNLLTDPDFFPGSTEALHPGLSRDDPMLREKAVELHEKFRSISLPGEVEQWPAWACLILEFSKSAIDRITTEAEAESRVRATREALLNDCVIVDGDRTGRNLFGRVKFPEAMQFREIVEHWGERYPKSNSKWVESLAEQIALGAQGHSPRTDWEMMPGATGGETDWCIPVVNWIRKVPARQCMQFDVYFIPMRVEEGKGRAELSVT